MSKKAGSIVLVVMLILAMTSPALAKVVSTDTGYITRLSAYDDFWDGAVFVWFKTGLEECPSGVYIKPAAPGAVAMIDFVLHAYTNSLTVRFQAYNDRLYKTSLCEADAVWLLR